VAVLMRAAVDFEYFRNIFMQKRRGAVFEFFFATLIAHGTKTLRARVLIFGKLGECPTV